MKAAFDPPSDFVPSPSGGKGKNKLWMILGGGCLVLVLIFGGLMAAGAFKAVSCCNQLQDVAAKTMAAQQFGMGWGTQVATGALDPAYEALTPAQKERTTPEAFKALFQPYAATMAAAPPQLFNTNAVHHERVTDVKNWRISLQFARPADKEMVVLTFDTVLLPGDDPIAFGIENIDIDQRPRVLGLEAPAREVIEFHDELQAGRYEMAYGRLPQAFKDATSMETFRAFLEGEGSILVGSTLDVQEVSYPEPGRATVMAIAAGKGRKGVVQYELQAPPMAGLQMWQIVTISPVMQADSVIENLDDAGTERVESDAAKPAEENPENP